MRSEDDVSDSDNAGSVYCFASTLGYKNAPACVCKSIRKIAAGRRLPMGALADSCPPQTTRIAAGDPTSWCAFEDVRAATQPRSSPPSIYCTSFRCVLLPRRCVRMARAHPTLSPTASDYRKPTPIVRRLGHMVMRAFLSLSLATP